MYENEKAQLQEPHTVSTWGNFNLDRHVEQAQALADEGDFDRLTAFPTCVLVLIEGADEVVESKLRRFRRHVDEGHYDFALGNQPQYVIDRVMALDPEKEA